MVYLIGGPPRCGKSTLARRLAQAVGCSWLQGDWLAQAIGAYVPDSVLLPEESLPISPTTPGNRRNDERYERYSSERIIAYYRAWAARTWPGTQALLEYARFDKEDFIIEGYQVDPVPLTCFLIRTELEGAEDIRAIFLYREAVEDIISSLKRGTDENDWVLRQTQEETTYRRIATMIDRALRRRGARRRRASRPPDTDHRPRPGSAVGASDSPANVLR